MEEIIEELEEIVSWQEQLVVALGMVRLEGISDQVMIRVRRLRMVIDRLKKMA